MTQSADHVLDHFDLFRQPEYKEMLENKKKELREPSRRPRSSSGFASGPRPANTAKRTSPARR